MHRKLTNSFVPFIFLNGTGRRRKTRRRANVGLTLTEVVIASAILIIAMVPIIKGLTTAHLGTVILERKSRSLVLAQGKLDGIKARSIYNYSQSFDESNVSLEGLYLCNVADEAAGSNLRKITVSVGYDYDGDNILDTDEIEVTQATYLAKRWES
jgi:Tfp pilus assembly protein PilV